MHNPSEAERTFHKIADRAVAELVVCSWRRHGQTYASHPNERRLAPGYFIQNRLSPEERAALAGLTSSETANVRPDHIRLMLL